MDAFGLKSKFVVVTGSTGGIGRAIAVGFALFGAVVTINGRTDVSVSKAISEILAENPSIKPEQLAPAPGDIVAAENAAKFLAMVRALAEPHGGCKVLVNNLGIFASEDWINVSDEREREYFETNVLSGSRLAKAFLPEFLEKNEGVILTIASEAAFKPLPNLLAYSVSKLSGVGLARGIAELTKGTRVRSNSVIVGPTATPGVLNYRGAMKHRLPIWKSAHSSLRLKTFRTSTCHTDLS